MPSDVVGLTNVTALEGGFFHSLALLSAGSVWAWGDNREGQIGQDPELVDQSPTPAQVLGFINITAIAGGEFHSLALKNDGTVWSWGSNVEGQLGDGTYTSRHTPSVISGLSDIVAISCGCSHSMALDSEGNVWTWGRNVEGQLGNGSNTVSNVPVQASNISDIQSINAGAKHCLALQSNGTVWAWGWNSKGQLGNGDQEDSNTPLEVELPSASIDQVSAGYEYSMALKSDGTLLGWGANEWGQIGEGLPNLVLEAAAVEGVQGVASIVTGGQHTLGLTATGSVLGWGKDTYGQLGQGKHGGIPELID